MPKSKGRKYYRNSPKTPVKNKPAAAAAAERPAVVTSVPKATPPAAKPGTMVTTTTLGTELKVIGVLTVVILAAIIVLSVVLR